MILFDIPIKNEQNRMWAKNNQNYYNRNITVNYGDTTGTEENFIPKELFNNFFIAFIIITMARHPYRG